MKSVLSLCLLLMCLSASALEGGPELIDRVRTYLLNNDKDPRAELRTGRVEVSETGTRQTLSHWAVPGLAAPTEADLPSATDALVARADETRRKKVNGKWVLKTQLELDDELNATPEGKRKTKRAAVRTQLRTELTTAGFTNTNFSVDDVNDWLETVTLTAPVEKKITRLLARYENLSHPEIKVDTQE